MGDERPSAAVAEEPAPPPTGIVVGLPSAEEPSPVRRRLREQLLDNVPLALRSKPGAKSTSEPPVGDRKRFLLDDLPIPLRRRIAAEREAHHVVEGDNPFVSQGVHREVAGQDRPEVPVRVGARNDEGRDEARMVRVHGVQGRLADVERRAPPGHAAPTPATDQRHSLGRDGSVPGLQGEARGGGVRRGEDRAPQRQSDGSNLMAMMCVHFACQPGWDYTILGAKSVFLQSESTGKFLLLLMPSTSIPRRAASGPKSWWPAGRSTVPARRGGVLCPLQEDIGEMAREATLP